jgi:glycine cleavage system H lipoate-binding protein
MANRLFKIKINDAGDLESLMDEAAYNAMIG